MTNLNDLIERLEKATGPNRLADFRIAEAIEKTYGTYADIPRFTESIDAALSLVPDGDPWTLGQNIHHRHWNACINEYGTDQEVRSRGFGSHKTSPAIALCIASLKAIDAIRSKEEQK